MKENHIHIRVIDELKQDFKESVKIRGEKERRNLKMTDAIVEFMQSHVKKWVNQ